MRDEDSRSVPITGPAFAETIAKLWDAGSPPDLKVLASHENSTNLEDFLAALIIDQRNRFLCGTPLTADHYFEVFPRLLEDRSIAFDLIWSEFLIREALGEALILTEFMGRFEGFDPEFRSQMEVHDFLNPSRIKVTPKFEKFVIVGEIGRGSMGVVYKAKHIILDVFVAMKIFPATYPQDRLFNEARLIARIKSQHVVTVYDCLTQEDGSHAIVMEYIQGGNLLARMKQAGGAIGELQCLRWMKQVCEGMIKAADCKMVHRDIKPTNLLIDEFDNIKIADYGLAKMLDSAVDDYSSLKIAGTPHYMAPEQAEDPRHIDGRIDIYSFGACFYHAITGKVPFDGTSPFSIMYKHKTAPLVSPTVINPAISPRTSETIERCMAKDPRDRFASFSDILLALTSDGRAATPWETGYNSSLDPIFARFSSNISTYVGLSCVYRPHAELIASYYLGNGKCINLFHGDIVSLSTDVIVNSSTSALYFDYGVSQAIGNAAGPYVIREGHKLAGLNPKPGRVLVTSAGDLSAKLLFHAITAGEKGGQIVLPSRALLIEIIRNCFYHAESLDVESISFPLLGTGGCGFPVPKCLEIMFHSLAIILSTSISRIGTTNIVICGRKNL